MRETPEELAKRLGVPVIPPLPGRPAHGYVAVCGACGRGIQQVEGYYCPRQDCPVQLKAT